MIYIMMDGCHYTFAKTHRMYYTKSEFSRQLWNVGEDDVSVSVHQLQQMHHLVGDVMMRAASQV